MTYREILERFTQRVPTTRALIFCDHEGEAIEFVSEFDSYHTQLFGAYQSELMFAVKNAIKDASTGALDCLFLRTAHGSISIWPIGSSYYLAAMCRASLPAAHPAVHEIRRSLEAEV